MNNSNMYNTVGTARSGFSFIEIAIGFLVLGLCALPIFLLFRHGSTGTVQTREEIQAFGFASDLLNHLKLLPFDDDFLSPKNRLEVPTTPTSSGIVLPAMTSGFRRFLTITDQSPVYPNPYRYKTVTVEMEWVSSGISKTVRMPFLLFCGPK